jgi:Peptidase family M23
VRGYSLPKPSPGRLAATALLLACLLFLFGEPGAIARNAAPTETTKNDVVGASISHPAKWSVERERYTFDETYGFTLWRPDSGLPHDHGGTPAVRVALAYGLRPNQIEATVREKLAAYPDLPMTREGVSVGEKEEGVAVGPIPGSTPSTQVYVPVNGRVYQINVYAEKPGQEGLDEDDERLLSSMRFYPPSRLVRSLGLPDANAPEALYAPGGTERERAAHEAAAEEASEATFEAAALRRGREARIAEGCWRADPDFFFQTQHDLKANSNPDDGIPTGYTVVGKPNYWGEYTHGDLDYGRCTEPEWCNDKFAVDYPLNRGDAVFSPFREGTVTFAGRNITHKDYGILVAIKAANGKYVSLSAHLDSLAAGIRQGTEVDRHTVIGYAGDTGGGDIPVGRPHLHQAYYRYPSYEPDGSPYGGAGLQVIRYRYFRGDGGVYTFGWKKKPGIKAKGSKISY